MRATLFPLTLALVCIFILPFISACDCGDNDCECGDCPDITDDDSPGIVGDDDTSPDDDDDDDTSPDDDDDTSPDDDDDDDTSPDDDDDDDDDTSPDDDDDDDDDDIVTAELGYVDGGNFSGAGLALGAGGAAQIVSCRARQVQVYSSAGGWDYQVADYGIFGNAVAAQAPNGSLHVALHNWEEKSLYYLQNSRGTWDALEVDSNGLVGHYSAIAVDASGVHIAYNVEDTGGESIGVRYAFNSGGGWSIQEVVEEPGAGKFPAIALDSLGVPYITFNTETGVDLARPGADRAWEIQTLTGAKPRGRASGVDVDGNDLLHVVFHNDATPDGLNYASGDFDTLSYETIPGPSGVGDTMAMDVDENDVVHVIYYSSATGSVYGHNAAKAWTFTPITASQAVYVKANDLDDVAVSLGGLGVQRKTGASWNSPIYFGHSFTVGHSDLAIAPVGGQVRAAYIETNTATLRFALEGPPPWPSQVVDMDIGSEVENISLAIDGAGVAHVVFFDGTNNRLRYGHNTAGAWEIANVSETVGAGKHSAMTLGADGTLHVSYFDEGGSDLVYARPDSSGWLSFTVADASLVGTWSDIAEHDGDVYIAFVDVTDSAIKLAVGGDGAWTIDTADESGGDFVEIIVENGTPHLAYHRGVTVWYAVRSGGTWARHEVAGEAAAAEVALARLDADRLAIAYQHVNEDLMVAVGDGSAWNSQTLDTLGAVGEHVSIAPCPSGACAEIGYAAQGALWTALIY
jgi:hypothetical protein